MPPITDISWGIAGLLSGGLLVGLLLRSRLAVLAQQLLHSADQLQKTEATLTVERQGQQALRQMLEQARLRLTEVEARREQEQIAAREQLALLEQARTSLTQQFEALANRIFESRQVVFQQQSQQQLEGLVAPLREQLVQFRQKIEHVYENENRDRTALITEIRLLKNLSQQVSQDAANLAIALKGDNKRQGNWGEVILERILEQSGLEKGREYDTQVNLRNEEGERRLPDAVVHLPEGRDIVIDAKVTLVDYQRYCEALDEVERERALKAHVQAVRAHVQRLSDKSYQQLEGMRTLDFVLLFMPVEAAFSLAFQSDQSLFAEAFDKGIVIVSPTTLLATLRTVHSIWRYEKQNRNAEKIAQEAGKLFDQFARVGESLEELGRQLQRATQSYDETMKRFSSGRGNLVTRTENLKKLGARTSKQLPGAFVGIAEDEESL